MAEYVNIGEKVEGAKCGIYTRREDFKGLRQDPITHKAMIVYELSLNCSVEVIKKLPLSDVEAKLREDMGVHTELSDKLKADSITLYVAEKRKLKIEVKEGQTSTHGGHLFSTKKRTIGEIKYPFQNIQSKFVLPSADVLSLTESSELLCK